MNDPITHIPERQRDEYRQWIASPSITTPHSEEMVIAWNLSRELGLPPVNVIRALRKQKGQEAIQSRVDSAVRDDPSIEFINDGRVRRTRYTTDRTTPASEPQHDPDSEFEHAAQDLENGELHRFGDWPVNAFSKGPPGVYTVWRDNEFIYVGISYRDQVETSNPQARGVWGRLSMHASGRRSGDQFNIYICDRFVVPELGDEDMQALRGGARFLDGRTRDYISKRLCFRVHLTKTGAQARRVETHIRTHGLPNAGRPLLNPLGDPG